VRTGAAVEMTRDPSASNADPHQIRSPAHQRGTVTPPDIATRTDEMIWTARILLGLIALFFLVSAFRFFFMPEAIAEEFFIVPSGVAGLSTIRADLGGGFFAVGTFVLLGTLGRGAHWLYAAATFLAAAAVGRAIGLMLDGAVPNALIAFGAEVVFVLVLLFAARALRTLPNRSN
jgi:Domain of unknown function (DUF4345)